MERWSFYLGLALVLSSISIPFSVHAFEKKARLCRALDDSVHVIDEPELSVFRLATSHWLRYFDELNLDDVKYRAVRLNVVEIQRAVEKLERGRRLVSPLEAETEVRRIEESLRDVPSIGEELVGTTYALVPFVMRRFLVVLLVVLILLAPNMVMDHLIASSEREMRYRV